MTRLITALIGAPLLIAGILKLPPRAFLVFIIIVASISLIEFCVMYRIPRRLTIIITVLGALTMASIQYGYLLDTLMLCLMIITMMRLFSIPSPEKSLLDVAPAIFGYLYIPVLISVQIPLRGYSPALIVSLYCTVWMSDATAYYIGRRFGRRKLYESMSPNKTIAGAVGSLCGGVVTSLIMRELLLQWIPLHVAAVLGLSVGAITIAGDLVESMLKRDAGVKDSSVLIPGHGGMLDKVDGVLFAGPVYFWLLRAFDALPSRFQLPF